MSALGQQPNTSAVDLSRLRASLDADRARYGAGQPFPHLVIDGFLTRDAAASAYTDFDEAASNGWTKYIHVNERKFAHTDPSTWGRSLETITAELQSDEFVAYLSTLTGITGLMADPELDGGGLHRSTRGGFLNVHADFTAHHRHERWRRRINLILYLNQDWDTEWGGALQLWSTDMSHCVEEIVPAGNRALIFTTSDHSFHGHPEPMTCPDGVYRQSLALYYFTEERNVEIHSTNYRPRPDDGLHSIPIILDRTALRVYDTVKRRLRLSDGTVSRWLGRLDRLRSRRKRP